MKAGLDALKNNAANPAQVMAVVLGEALDILVLLSFHCIVAQNDLPIVSDEHGLLLLKSLHCTKYKRGAF